jgi:2-polyprenyl-3-methyl-5-hydroxy-6-metoxy-1,4-benzoquinol methylase
MTVDTGVTALERSCPICAHGFGERLFRQSFSTLDESSFLDGYDVVICSECGFGFADRIPPQTVFDAHYAQMSRYEYHQRGGEESQYDRDRLQAIVATIEQLVPDHDAKVLDVGCANGRLLSFLRDAGYTHGEGLDPSPACAATALALYDVNVRVGTIKDLDRGTGRFDVMIALGVLEHIRDLSAAMRSLTSTLTPGGFMYLAVPDAEVLADWPNAPFQAFSNEHINFFSRESLANLGRSVGLEPVFAHAGAFAQGPGTSEPWVATAFVKQPGRRALVPDRITGEALRWYISGCRDQERAIHGTIDALVARESPLIVWGTGTHTTRLLATSNLGKAKIEAYVDSNTHYQGMHLGGVPVISPHELRTHSAPILISSRMYQDEIANQIRNTLGLTNELIRLYEL